MFHSLPLSSSSSQPFPEFLDGGIGEERGKEWNGVKGGLQSGTLGNGDSER